MKCFLGIIFFSCITCFIVIGQSDHHHESKESKSAYYISKVHEKLNAYKFREALPILDSLSHYALAENKKNDLAFSFQAKGVIYSAFGRIDTAEVLLSQALDLYLEVSNHESAGLTLCGLADFDKLNGNIDDAFDKLRRAQKISALIKSPVIELITTNYLGSLYNLTGNTDSSYYYFNKELSLIDSEDSIKLGVCHGNLATVFFRVYNYERAVKSAYKSMNYINESKAPISKNKIRILLAHIRLNQGNYVESKALSLKALNYFKSTQLDKYVIECKLLLSNLYSLENDHENANQIFNEIKEIDDHENLVLVTNYNLAKFKLAKENSSFTHVASIYHRTKELIYELNYLPEKSVFLKLESDYLQQIGKFNESKKALENYYIVKDSLSDIQRFHKIENLEIKYETEKKEAMIERQQLSLLKGKYKSNFLISILAAVLLLGALLFIFLHREHGIKQKLKEKSIKLKENEILYLKNENKVINLQSILEGQEEERKRIALDLHDNIGSMVTAIKVKVMNIQQKMKADEKHNVKDQLDKMISNVSSELRRISHNMTPIAFDLTGIDGAIHDLIQRLEENNIEVINDITNIDIFKDKQKSIVLFRIFQEIFQNIEKHSKANQVRLESFIDETSLHIIIADNGLGMPKDKWQNSKSLGLKSIKSRINYLKGKVEYSKINGSNYNITIPII